MSRKGTRLGKDSEVTVNLSDVKATLFDTFCNDLIENTQSIQEVKDQMFGIYQALNLIEVLSDNRKEREKKCNQE